MTEIVKTDLAFWPNIGLRFSTSPWHPPWNLTAQDQALLFKAMAEGWRLRAASPRWDEIWRPAWPVLLASRVIILPRRGFGLDGQENLALVLLRLQSAGFRLSDPAPQHLQRAQTKWKAALAPAWRNVATAHDK